MSAITFALLLFAAEPPWIPLPEQLDFLEGCWAGPHLVERYGDHKGGVLLGTVKTLHPDKPPFFEFLRIFSDAGGVWLQPYPYGKQDAPRFELVELEADKAAFENLAHDFPQRIAWRLLADGSLLTRVAGLVDGRDAVTEYVSEPVECRD